MVPEIWSETDQFFLSFWAIFSPCTSPLMILNIKILKKNEKKCLEILSFYTYMCTMNEDHMLYGSWNIRRNSFQPLDNLENQILINIEKKTWRYHFTHLHRKWQSYDVGSWYMEHGTHNFLLFCLLGVALALRQLNPIHKKGP